MGKKWIFMILSILIFIGLSHNAQATNDFFIYSFYQETENETADDFGCRYCPLTNLYDGNWETYGCPSIYNSVYMNYTIPTDTNSAILKYKMEIDASGAQIFFDDIPSDCMTGDKIILMYHYYYGNVGKLRCWNYTLSSWHTIKSSTNNYGKFWECGVYWNSELANPTDPATYTPGQEYEFNASVYDVNGTSDVSHVLFEWDGTNYTHPYSNRQNGLVGYWKMNGEYGTSVSDVSGNSNTGTYNGETLNDGTLHNSPAWVTGKYGEALDFDGTDDYVTGSTIPEVNLNTNWTISVWVKLASNNPDGTIIKTNPDGTNRISLVLNNNGNVFCFDTYDGSTTNALSTGIIEVGEWYHIVYGIESGTKFLYLNTAQQNGATSGQYSSGQEFDIGSNSGANRFFNGTIDDVRIYDRALSSDEIQEIYENNTFIREGMVGYWRFDEGTGTTAHDTHHIATDDNQDGSKFGNALSFDGTDDRINIPNDNLFNLTVEGSIGFWIYTLSRDGERTVIDKDLSGYYDDMKFGINIDSQASEKIRFGFNRKSDSTLQGVNDVDVLPLKEWVFYMGTFNTSGIYLYKNGVLVNSNNAIVKVSNTADLYIGSNRGIAKWFNGTIDEVMIFNRSLSENEIKRLYEDGYRRHNSTSEEYWFKIHDQPAGSYNYGWYANDTAGNYYYRTDTYTINKAPVTMHLAINGTESDQTLAYQNVTNTTAWTDEFGFSYITFTRDGSPVSNPEIIKLGADTYTYKSVFSHQNYTASDITRTLTINPKPSGLALSSTNGWDLTVGDSTTLSCSYASYLEETPVFKYNGVTVSNPYTVQPSAGDYTVFCGINDGQNFTTQNVSNTLSVHPPLTCTSNDTFAFKKNVTTATDITTLDFDSLVSMNYVKSDLSDVYIPNVTSVWKNTTASHYIVVNNTGLSNFVVYFGNYYAYRNYSEHPIENVQSMTGYEQINKYARFNLLDEFSGNYMFPPNATVTAIIRCSSGEDYIPISDNTTRFTLASGEYIDKVAVQVRYSASSYYSRQLYPAQTDALDVMLYLVDAYQHPLDRIDFNMADTDYYNSKLILYKNIENSTITITEGYFDISHYFSAYLAEDIDYYIKTHDSTHGYTEFGRITVVTPMEKQLGQTYYNLNPNAQIIGDHLILNSYVSEDRKTLYVKYSDDLNETQNVTISIYFGNGTLFYNNTYFSNSLNLNFNTTDYVNESWRIVYNINHETFGEVNYEMSIFAPFGYNLGISSYLYELISLGIILLIGGITTRKSLIIGMILTMSSVLIFYGIGWLPLSPLSIGFIIFLLALSIISHIKSGGVE